ncbi:MAG: hypothetical protein WC284_06315 [Candidimonas sp.]
MITETGRKHLIDIIESKCYIVPGDGFLDFHIPLMTKEIPDFVDECNTGGIHDTCVRDRVSDYFGMHYVGRPWPINMDTEESTNDFITKYVEAVKADPLASLTPE